MATAHATSVARLHVVTLDASRETAGDTLAPLAERRRFSFLGAPDGGQEQMSRAVAFTGRRGLMQLEGLAPFVDRPAKGGTLNANALSLKWL